MMEGYPTPLDVSAAPNMAPDAKAAGSAWVILAAYQESLEALRDGAGSDSSQSRVVSLDVACDEGLMEKRHKTITIEVMSKAR